MNIDKVMDLFREHGCIVQSRENLARKILEDNETLVVKQQIEEKPVLEEHENA